MWRCPPLWCPPASVLPAHARTLSRALAHTHTTLSHGPSHAHSDARLLGEVVPLLGGCADREVFLGVLWQEGGQAPACQALG